MGGRALRRLEQRLSSRTLSWWPGQARLHPPARLLLATLLELPHCRASQVAKAIRLLAGDAADALTDALLDAGADFLAALNYAGTDLTNSRFADVAEMVLFLAREMIDARRDFLPDFLPPFFDAGADGLPPLFDAA